MNCPSPLKKINTPPFYAPFCHLISFMWVSHFTTFKKEWNFAAYLEKKKYKFIAAENMSFYLQELFTLNLFLSNKEIFLN